MSAAVLFHLLAERLSWGLQARVPEPDLVMEGEAQTAAFAKAGESGGPLSFLYLYNALQISALLRPGDRVLDLACGPANQLMQIAELNPQVQFVGLDASTDMLHKAEQAILRRKLDKISLVQGDMSALGGHADASMDCVICTMSLHHLPDTAALAATAGEVRRVLKPQGRFYLIDFSRLKLRRTQRFFAQDLRHPGTFEEDYFNSLRAAFSVQELTDSMAALGANRQRHVTFAAPFMVVFCSGGQNPLSTQTVQMAKAVLCNLSAANQQTFQSLTRWFRMSGYPLPCVL